MVLFWVFLLVDRGFFKAIDKGSVILFLIYASQLPEVPFYSLGSVACCVETPRTMASSFPRNTKNF